MLFENIEKDLFLKNITFSLNYFENYKKEIFFSYFDNFFYI